MKTLLFIPQIAFGCDCGKSAARPSARRAPRINNPQQSMSPAKQAQVYQSADLKKAPQAPVTAPRRTV